MVVRLENEYFSCTSYMQDTISYAIGVSMGNSSFAAVMVMFIFFCILGRHLRVHMNYRTGYVEDKFENNLSKRYRKKLRKSKMIHDKETKAATSLGAQVAGANIDELLEHWNRVDEKYQKEKLEIEARLQELKTRHDQNLSENPDDVDKHLQYHNFLSEKYLKTESISKQDFLRKAKSMESES